MSLPLVQTGERWVSGVHCLGLGARWILRTQVERYASPLSPILTPESRGAQVISKDFYIMMAIGGLILLVVVLMVGLSLWRFRSTGEKVDPDPVYGNRRLEIAWTLIPCVIVAGLFWLTFRDLPLIDSQRSERPFVQIVAHQWWWEVHYPDQSIVTANEIHIPCNRRVLVELESADVIHDFWVPQLGRKMDMIPGQTNRVWIEAKRPGIYQGSCAEFCGAQHAWMRFLVIAQAPTEFAAWQATQATRQPQPAETSSRHGEQLFQQKSCAGCHSGPGSVGARLQIGPDLSHLSGRQTLAAGVLPNSRKALGDWLLDPQKWKPGTLMPNLHLSPAETEDLVDYLEGTP